MGSLSVQTKETFTHAHCHDEKLVWQEDELRRASEQRHRFYPTSVPSQRRATLSQDLLT